MAIFKKFDHIGVVVENLQQAMDALAHFFDLECREVMEIKDAGIRIAFYPLGSGQMELIEFKKPLDGVDPIVTRPGAGVQHVAFQVDDFQQALKTLTAKGLKLVKGFPRTGAHGQVAFFYPTAGLDLLIEICES
ncbi:MAG: VOC family protein [Desulfobacterales bacterium]|jgi:methylmalonyl-CoA epimerase